MVFMAPRTPLQWVLRTAYLLAAVLALTYAVEVWIFQLEGITFRDELRVTPWVALPFILLMLSTAARQTRLIQELSYLASTDPLTQLPNRAAFLAFAEDQQARSPAMILIADADHFKAINDRYGHDVGDEALISISHKLRELAGPDGIAARLGGEEFALCLPNPYGHRCQTICAALCAGVKIPQRAQPVTLSLGITTLRRDVGLPDLLKQADQALYVAKDHGRARAVWWPDQTFALPAPELSSRTPAA